MSRYTSTYADFVGRLDEVAILRSKAAQLERQRHSNKQRAQISALCRGSVVLLSSHIEAYVKELGEHTLDRIYDRSVCRSRISPVFFYHISKDKIDTIRDGADAEVIARHMHTFVATEAALWERNGAFNSPITPYGFSSGFSNPKFEKIKNYLARFGYTDFKHDYQKHLGPNAKSTRTKLDQIVDVRNAIAHGDPLATRTPAEINEMMETAKVFCRTVDKIFGDWCSKSLCGIR